MSNASRSSPPTSPFAMTGQLVAHAWPVLVAQLLSFSASLGMNLEAGSMMTSDQSTP